MVPVSRAPLDAPTARTAGLLAVCCFCVFVANLRQMGAADTVPARLLPFSIIREHNVDLDEFAWLRPGSYEPYFLRHGAEGHWFSTYPVVTPLLLAPLYVPVTAWLDAAGIGDDDVRFRLTSVVMERIGAALVTAASIAVLFVALSRLTAPGCALAIAIAYAFGTSAWSISSQALWQHGAAQLALASLSLCLLKPPARGSMAAAGFWAALAVVVRPTMIIFALLALVYVWRQRRTWLLEFIAMPLAGVIALLWYNLAAIGLVSGGYGMEILHAPSVGRVMGLLVSPNRGLLVFTPAAILALPAIIRLRRQPPWLACLAVGALASVLLFSCFVEWWGGACYGPRYLSDALPAIALLSVPAVERLRGTWSGRAVLVALAVWGVIMQSIGVYADDDSWNDWPTTPSEGRLWDWHDLHVRRALNAGWHGADLGPLLWQMAFDPHPARLRSLDRQDLAATIAVRSPRPLRYAAGGTTPIELEVRNDGSATWPAFSDFSFLDCVVMYRWWHDGSMLRDVGGALPLSRNVAAGETLPLQARMELPRRAGVYQLELVLVQRVGLNTANSDGTRARVAVSIEE